MRRLALTVAALALAGAALGGCGDDDEPTADSTTSTTATTAAPTSGGDEPADATTTDQGGEGGSTTTAPDQDDTSSTTEGDDGVAAFCAAADRLDELFDELPDDTLEQVQEGAVQIADEVAALVEIAPDEIRDAVQAQADFFAELRDLAAEATSLDQVEEDADALSTSPELADASSALGEWEEQHCQDGVAAGG